MRISSEQDIFWMAASIYRESFSLLLFHPRAVLGTHSVSLPLPLPLIIPPLSLFCFKHFSWCLTIGHKLARLAMDAVAVVPSRVQVERWYGAYSLVRTHSGAISYGRELNNHTYIVDIPECTPTNTCTFVKDFSLETIELNEITKITWETGYRIYLIHLNSILHFHLCFSLLLLTMAIPSTGNCHKLNWIGWEDGMTIISLSLWIHAVRVELPTALRSA